MDGDGRVAPTDGNGMSTREHWDGCPGVFDLWWNVRVMGVGATRQGKTREVTGKPSMQEGMMDGNGWVRPYDDNGMSTRERWDECPSVFGLRWNVHVMGVGATRQSRREN